MLIHISNNYFGSTVHSSLVKAIDKQGVKQQFVYCPMQKSFKVNPAVREIDSVIIEKPRIFNRVIRYFPILKVLFSYYHFIKGLQQHGIKPTFIIAHNLWSDGMIAWFCSVFFKVPYLVAVRNTDINHFIPKLPHYRWLIGKVLQRSKATVFINESYLERINNNYQALYKKIDKAKIIFNGINSSWFDLSAALKEKIRPVQVCFLGSFEDNKNLKNTVTALENIRATGLYLHFVAIGGDKEQFKATAKLDEIPKWITVVNKTHDKELIAEHLSNSRVFLMASFHETFGLVYIEALSQCCCLIHSKGEGIDGIFDEPFVKGVNPRSIESIADEVLYLLNAYPNGVAKSDVERLLPQFSWDQIAKNYLKLINERNV